MRVIAGKARRLPLKTVPGLETRPTTDRIKETLFNMLQDEIADSRFLDLFAGSGGIGIEALSRGAGMSVFVENNRAAAACIRENLAFTRLEGQAEVITQDAVSAIRRMEGREPFDIIFMDPPYNKGLEAEALSILKDSSLVSGDTLIIVETALNADCSYLEEIGYILEKRKEYKTNAHLFIRRQKE
ncbi:UNVERIFIED_CONTAM: 16S rRNA (guanine966-N2)-methyltransferase [Murimonas intestini]|uniref:16S rRNA (Guanine966-N2)-methyltransferase n=1 Tax=Murimonas intestini TaxID=1337051 RepID=A0AB73TBC3_9FIRM